ncbi:MAG: hypothetical protein H7A34_02750 [bacterium]|nr:hypothetical protein [bacterium]
MKILINDQVSKIQPENELNLEDLMVRIQDSVHKQDQTQVIIDIKVDGKPLFDSSRNIRSYSLDSIKTIEVQTDNLIETIIRTLGTIKKDLPSLSEGMSNISTTLQAGNKEGALVQFSHICEEWRRIIQFLDNVSQLLQIDYSKLIFAEKTIDQANEELLLLLKDAKDSIEKDDLVMLSDLIEYELAPKIDEEITIVSELITHISAQKN